MTVKKPQPKMRFADERNGRWAHSTPTITTSKKKDEKPQRPTKLSKAWPLVEFIRMLKADKEKFLAEKSRYPKLF